MPKPPPALRFFLGGSSLSKVQLLNKMKQSESQQLRLAAAVCLLTALHPPVQSPQLLSRYQLPSKRSPATSLAQIYYLALMHSWTWGCQPTSARMKSLYWLRSASNSACKAFLRPRSAYTCSQRKTSVRAQHPVASGKTLPVVVAKSLVFSRARRLPRSCSLDGGLPVINSLLQTHI